MDGSPDFDFAYSKEEMEARRNKYFEDVPFEEGGRRSIYLTALCLVIMIVEPTLSTILSPFFLNYTTTKVMLIVIIILIVKRTSILSMSICEKAFVIFIISSIVILLAPCLEAYARAKIRGMLFAFGTMMLILIPVYWTPLKPLIRRLTFLLIGVAVIFSLSGISRLVENLGRIGAELK